MAEIHHEFDAALRRYTCGRAGCACGRRSGENWTIHCPNAAAHQHGDERPSASVRTGSSRLLVYCQVCGDDGKRAILDAMREDGVISSRPDSSTKPPARRGGVRLHGQRLVPPKGQAWPDDAQILHVTGYELPATKSSAKTPVRQVRVDWCAAGGKKRTKSVWWQRQTSGKYGPYWKAGLPKGTRVASLPLWIPRRGDRSEVLAAAEAVILCEGGKAAHALDEVLESSMPAVIAAAWLGGAGKPPNEVALRELVDANVSLFVWPDDDQPGREAAKRIVDTANRMGNTCGIIRWPSTPGSTKADAADWVEDRSQEAGGIVDELDILLDGASSKVETTPSPVGFRGNACATGEGSAAAHHAAVERGGRDGGHTSEGDAHDSSRQAWLASPAERIYEDSAGRYYYLLRTRRDPETGERIEVRQRISRFLIEPIELFEIQTFDGLEQALHGDLLLPGRRGGAIRITVPLRSFSTAKSITSSLPGEAAWLGSDSHARMLLDHLIDGLTDKPRTAATSKLGIQRHSGQWWWVDSRGEIQPEHAKASIRYVDVHGMARSVPCIEASEHDESAGHQMVQLIELATKSYAEPQAVTVLGWMLATAFAPLMRSWSWWRTFPLLWVFGPRGSGKTTLSSAVAPLAGVRWDLVAPQGIHVTRFALQMLLGSTDSLPIILEEYRRDAIDRNRADMLDSMLREVYQGGAASRGRKDLTTVRFEYRAPVCIVAEEPPSDQALADRTVMCWMQWTMLKQHHRQSMGFLRDSLTVADAAASTWMRWVIRSGLAGHEARVRHAMELLSSSGLSDKMSERRRRGLITVLAGCMAAREFALSVGASPPALLDEAVATKRILDGFMRVANISVAQGPEIAFWRLLDEMMRREEAECRSRGIAPVIAGMSVISGQTNGEPDVRVHIGVISASMREYLSRGRRAVPPWLKPDTLREVLCTNPSCLRRSKQTRIRTGKQVRMSVFSAQLLVECGAITDDSPVLRAGDPEAWLKQDDGNEDDYCNDQQWSLLE